MKIETKLTDPSENEIDESRDTKILVEKIDEKLKQGERMCNPDWLLADVFKRSSKKIPESIIQALINHFEKLGWKVSYRYNESDGSLLRFEETGRK